MWCDMMWDSGDFGIWNVTDTGSYTRIFVIEFAFLGLRKDTCVYWCRCRLLWCDYSIWCVWRNVQIQGTSSEMGPGVVISANDTEGLESGLSLYLASCIPLRRQSVVYLSPSIAYWTLTCCRGKYLVSIEFLSHNSLFDNMAIECVRKMIVHYDLQPRYYPDSGWGLAQFGSMKPCSRRVVTVWTLGYGSLSVPEMEGWSFCPFHLFGWTVGEPWNAGWTSYILASRNSQNGT